SYIATGLFDGARPPRFTRWLTPERVAEEVLKAVENRREFVILPWTARWMYRLCAGWPRSWYRAVDVPAVRRLAAELVSRGVPRTGRFAKHE
ncbi:MAG TPA: hypothetical protein VLM40_04530, partial [Gemmata sp.]|nr:hypothetical protein [Gemmata sp.]